jgi:hypothetical protein
MRITCRYRVLIEKRSSEGIGFFAPGSRLRPKPCVIRSSRVPHSVRRDPNRLPSYGFAPLQGVLPKLVLDTSRCEHLPWTFRAVWRIRSEGSYVPPKVPPVGLSSGFRESHPFRFAPPSALQIYFNLHTPFDFTLQGFPLSRSCPIFRKGCTAVPFLRGCAPAT